MTHLSHGTPEPSSPAIAPANLQVVLPPWIAIGRDPKNGGGVVVASGSTTNEARQTAIVAAIDFIKAVGFDRFIGLRHWTFAVLETAALLEAARVELTRREREAEAIS
jgi:hypothetical protein